MRNRPRRVGKPIGCRRPEAAAGGRSTVKTTLINPGMTPAGVAGSVGVGCPGGRPSSIPIIGVIRGAAVQPCPGGSWPGVAGQGCGHITRVGAAGGEHQQGGSD